MSHLENVYKTNRIKSLDGVRAISIIMVLLGHGAPSFPHYVSSNYLYGLISQSHLGVIIFFVISGYLITKLLLAEKEKSGTISIKNFYIRRFFRIFPVFYIYLILLIFLKNTYYPNIFSSYTLVFFSAIYLWNYKHYFIGSADNDVNGDWYMGHLWSLSMEEQFYLLWPLFFKKVNFIKIKKVIIFILISMPFIRLGTYVFDINSRGQIGIMLHTSGDAILTGCLAAILEKSEKFMTFLKYTWSKFGIVLIAFLYLFVINKYLEERYRGGYIITIGGSLCNILIVYILLWTIHVKSHVQNLLNKNWIIQIGLISYSLYIWQQLFLTKLYNNYFNQSPINLILIFLIGFSSYYFIEKPFLKLKALFSK